MKNPSAAHIDKIISAEIPDINVDPDGYNAVKKFMIHGPCGKLNTKSPCIRVEKKNILLGNRYVVPYHRNLIVKFDAHINVELCNYSRSIKYLFKYVHKGSDKTTATVQSIDNTEGIDEIKTYLDCRYISATEACWRIFQFDIHYRKPSVERLPFHLLGEHTVIFGEDKCPENVLGTPGVDKTKFTEWLETNKNNEDARELTYSDFPTCWVWNSKDKIWTRRKQGIAIGRIYFAHPSTGERFYMRMMLNFVKGCTSYESIRTVNGVTYSTFKGACYALGLLDDDKEWIDCLTEATLWATGNELRHLFVTILINCQVSDVTKLWKSNYTTLSEDITALQRKRFKMKDLQLNDQQVEAYTLFEIELIAKLRSESKIVLPVATSGIAALLLPNGRTAHSRFHIPLEVTAESTCEIRHGTLLAELLMQTSLIIWDEAPMANKYCFEALDKTLRDILRTRYENSTTKPFGGLTIICGGDFR
ncbi:uncharacterized protein LOC115713282 [Cannabis sativa]|uniref:uncharacterized protein LOC115713282 n=1 Tax=Cannabis sativa TaxID=3483 RepID=UPI0029CA9ED8|nr:uncharacterized protein LOC115713282 [Cannabis sativa]